MTDQDFLAMSERGKEAVKNGDYDAIHIVSRDHNEALSDLSAFIGAASMLINNPFDLSTIVKCAIEMAFYLGYTAGKDAPDLSLWEEQLSEDDND